MLENHIPILFNFLSKIETEKNNQNNTNDKMMTCSTPNKKSSSRNEVTSENKMSREHKNRNYVVYVFRHIFEIKL